MSLVWAQSPQLLKITPFGSREVRYNIFLLMCKSISWVHGNYQISRCTFVLDHMKPQLDQKQPKATVKPSPRSSKLQPRSQIHFTEALFPAQLENQFHHRGFRRFLLTYSGMRSSLVRRFFKVMSLEPREPPCRCKLCVYAGKLTKLKIFLLFLLLKFLKCMFFFFCFPE